VFVNDGDVIGASSFGILKNLRFIGKRNWPESTF
jgi:hypothetical protein